MENELLQLKGKKWQRNVQKVSNANAKPGHVYDYFILIAGSFGDDHYAQFGLSCK